MAAAIRILSQNSLEHRSMEEDDPASTGNWGRKPVFGYKGTTVKKAKCPWLPEFLNGRPQFPTINRFPELKRSILKLEEGLISEKLLDPEDIQRKGRC